MQPSLETAIIVGCLSCCLIFILLTSYFFFGYGQPIESHSSDSGADPPLRSMLNISGPSYLMFREPPPPYFAEPPPSRRRYRRHRRHPRVSLSPVPSTNNPVSTAPGDAPEDREVTNDAVSVAFKGPEETPSVSSAWISNQNCLTSKKNMKVPASVGEGECTQNVDQLFQLIFPKFIWVAAWICFPSKFLLIFFFVV